MPAWQRAARSRAVTSPPVEPDARPRRAASAPAIRLNSVVLPAPLGPMTPSASPSRDLERDGVGDAQAPKDFSSGRVRGRSSAAVRASRRLAARPAAQPGRRCRSDEPVAVHRTRLRRSPPACRRSGSPERSGCRPRRSRTCRCRAAAIGRRPAASWRCSCCAKGGSAGLPKAILPTIVSRLDLLIASTLAFGSPASAERLSESTASSNSAWAKPICCVHPLPLACSYALGEIGGRSASQRGLEGMGRRPPHFGRQVVRRTCRALRARPGTAAPCRPRRSSA